MAMGEQDAVDVKARQIDAQMTDEERFSMLSA
jgi:hypothetical protein